MPEWLTRKVGPLPVWGYGLIGVGIFFVYRMRKSKSTSATSATPSSANYASTTPPNYTEPTTSVSTPGGFNYSGPLSGLQTIIPTGALAATNGQNPYNLQPGQTGQGGGLTNPGGGPLSDAAGNTYVNFATPQAAWSYLNAGNTGFVETAPGSFSPVTASTVPAGSTWVYQKVPTA